MKKTILALSLLTLVSANAASITFDNLRLSGTDLVLLDNAGVPLTEFTAAIYSGTAPTEVSAISSLPAAITTIDFSQANGNVLGGGQYAGSFDVDNLAGTFTGLDLFVVFSDGTDYAVIDIASEYGDETATAPFSVDEPFTDPTLITLQDPASGLGDFDYSALNAGTQAAYGLRLATVVPEPSSILLGGLALLGGVLRRRR